MNKTHGLRRVTLTGVDETTDLDKLHELCIKYPFAEVGVLLSLDRAGKEPRYPHVSLLKDLKRPGFKIAVHLCGRIARNAVVCPQQVMDALYVLFNDVRAPMTIADILEMSCDEHTDFTFERVQINVGTNPSKWPPLDLLENVVYNQVEIQAILQTSNFQDVYEHPAIKFLHDCSGGRGIETQDRFDSPGDLKYVGFAGGIKPGNVETVIQRIESLGEFDYWIDAESGLRDQFDCLDLSAVEEYLDSCRPFVVS